MDWKDRTKVILTQRKMSQAELARRLDVTKAAVTVWLKDEVSLTKKNTLKIQYKISAILGVTPEYLISGVSREDPKGRSVPHLASFQEIADWITGGIASESADWLTCPTDCSKRSFSFTVTGSAMDSAGQNMPSLPNGMMIFIDPKEPLEFGKFCLFQDQCPTLGIYEEMNNTSLLVFPNPRFQALVVVKDNYIGRAIGSYQSF